MDICAIAAVDRNWGIGNKGKLLTSIPGDMKFFRQKTLGSTIIMGRVTLESFPEMKPLKNRNNIVLTGNENYSCNGADIVHTVEEALEKAASYDAPVFIIGGETVYREFLPYCSLAYITKIDYEYEADAHFPDLDADPEWELADEGDELSCFDLLYNFNTYRRISNDKE